MKNIGILGSTGSIGTQTLEVIKNMPGLFDIKYLTAQNNIELLAQQAKEFLPEIVCIVNEKKYIELKNLLKNLNIKIVSGRKSLLELAGKENIDITMNSLVGAPGMEPTLCSIHAGTDIALSNKESLVMAGEIITNMLKEKSVKLFPVDSEHSAIWQCLRGENKNQINKLILTGSGGPFRTRPINTFDSIEIKDALKHPNWDMGSKITIDSATMMNKGLEVIEACWLFNMKPKNVDIIIHPQSIIHSMVEFLDGSVKAQLGNPEMKIPIQYALSYPNHTFYERESLDLVKIGSLTFEKPDLIKFPCIKLAYEAIEKGGTFPIVLNIANDEVVAAFLGGQISFIDIPHLIENALEQHEYIKDINLDVILHTSKWTYNYINEQIKAFA